MQTAYDTRVNFTRRLNMPEAVRFECRTCGTPKRMPEGIPPRCCTTCGGSQFNADPR